MKMLSANPIGCYKIDFYEYSSSNKIPDINKRDRQKSYGYPQD